MDDVFKQNALSIIEKVFREQFLNKRLCVTENTTPVDISEWDSLAHVHLLAAIEDAFSIRFTAEDMATIDSVTVLLAKIMERREFNS